MKAKFFQNIGLLGFLLLNCTPSISYSQSMEIQTLLIKHNINSNYSHGVKIDNLGPLMSLVINGDIILKMSDYTKINLESIDAVASKDLGVLLDKLSDERINIIRNSIKCSFTSSGGLVSPYTEKFSRDLPELMNLKNSKNKYFHIGFNCKGYEQMSPEQIQQTFHPDPTAMKTYFEQRLSLSMETELKTRKSECQSTNQLHFKKLVSSKLVKPRNYIFRLTNSSQVDFQRVFATFALKDEKNNKCYLAKTEAWFDHRFVSIGYKLLAPNGITYGLSTFPTSLLDRGNNPETGDLGGLNYDCPLDGINFNRSAETINEMLKYPEIKNINSNFHYELSEAPESMCN